MAQAKLTYIRLSEIARDPVVAAFFRRAEAEGGDFSVPACILPRSPRPLDGLVRAEVPAYA